MQDFRKLKVWQKSHAITLSIYKITAPFPSEERYGLTSQLRRSCSSIPANIAEGCGRQSNKDLARYLHISMGSACETEYHILLSHDLGYIDQSIYDRLNSQLVEVKQMLSSLIATIKD